MTSDVLQITSLRDDKRSVHKFGYNTDVGTTEEDIWEGGGVYTWLTSPTVLYASCTAASTNSITVQGLDDKFLEQEAIVTLNGTTQVALAGTWLRVHRAFNHTGTDLSGDVYIAENAGANITAGVPDDATQIKLFVGQASQQTLHSMYTIPANFTGYLTRVRFDIASDKTATFKFYTRIDGQVWRLKDIFSSAGNSVEVNMAMWQKLPAKCDMRAAAIGSAQPTPVTCIFDILLVESS